MASFRYLLVSIFLIKILLSTSHFLKPFSPALLRSKLDVVVENEVTSATVEFTIPSMQRMVLAQTPPVAAHVTVDVPIVANIEAPIEAPTMDTDETNPDEK